MASSSHTRSPRPTLVYTVEGITCLGTNLLLLGIYFYTKERLGWSLIQNFLLAAGQGAIYIVGSLLAHSLTQRLGRGRALVGIYAMLTVLAGVAWVARESPVLLTSLLLVYTLFTSFNWPILESLVSTGVPAHELSRRIAVYNLCWAGTGAIAIAFTGMLIKYAPAAMFLVPVAVHLAGSLLMMRHREPAVGAAAEGHAHLGAEPELLASRKLALALSRVSLPATYVVIYSLMSMLPSLPVISDLSPVAQTAVGSLWMAVRCVTFAGLGVTGWWHTRPRVLVVAAVLMALAFLGIVLPAGRIWPFAHAPLSEALTIVVLSEVLLGISVGVIYAGSLYFGMVLSEGSTEHSGYHEALIGLGSGLGPAVGAAAGYLRPGDSTATVTAVTAVVGLSVLATIVTAMPRGRQS